MTTKISSIILSILILFSSSLAVRAEVVDRVLAVVNDELITQSELDKVLIPLYMQYKQLYTNKEELLLKMDELRKNVLNHMISEKLILCEARKQQIKIKPEEIEKKIRQLKSKFPSAQEFEKALISQGASLVQLQEKFEEELLKEKFININIKRMVMITPSEISDYYNAHIEDFRLEPEAQVLDIFIKVKEGEDKDAANAKAEDILKRLQKGEDFSELATLFSDGAHAKDGGSIGYVSKGQLKKELDDVVFSLNAGEISQIVTSETGYHIFMVVDRKEGIMLSLEDAHDKIRDILYRQKASEKLDKLMEGFKKNAYISIK